MPSDVQLSAEDMELIRLGTGMQYVSSFTGEDGGHKVVVRFDDGREVEMKLTMLTSKADDWLSKTVGALSPHFLNFALRHPDLFVVLNFLSSDSLRAIARYDAKTSDDWLLLSLDADFVTRHPTMARLLDSLSLGHFSTRVHDGGFHTAQERTVKLRPHTGPDEIPFSELVAEGGEHVDHRRPRKIHNALEGAHADQLGGGLQRDEKGHVKLFDRDWRPHKIHSALEGLRPHQGPQEIPWSEYLHLSDSEHRVFADGKAIDGLYRPQGWNFEQYLAEFNRHLQVELGQAREANNEELAMLRRTWDAMPERP